jgi:hypothetical protein
MDNPDKKVKMTVAEMKKQRVLRIIEMKENLSDLRVEEEYWRLLASISSSKHKMFLINLEKAQYGKDISDTADNNKKDNSK